MRSRGRRWLAATGSWAVRKPLLGSWPGMPSVWMTGYSEKARVAVPRTSSIASCENQPSTNGQNVDPHGKGVGAGRTPGTIGAKMCCSGAYTSHCRPALYLHTPLQLLPARVPVQTLTEHELKRECRRCHPLKTRRFRNSSIGCWGSERGPRIMESRRDRAWSTAANDFTSRCRDCAESAETRSW